MAITLDKILADYHSIKISDGTNDLAIDGSGYITANINGTVTVDASDLDIRDLTHVSDSMKIGDGTEFLEVNADGSINAVVSATDLDIRDLDSATDSVEIKTAAGQALDIDASGYLTVNLNGSDFDIRDLSHTQDSIKLGDGTDFLEVNADGSLNAVVTATDLDIRDLAFATDSVTAHQGGTWTFNTDAYSTWKNSQVTVGTSAAVLVATALSGRGKVLIQNKGNQDVYIGPDALVTSSNGIEIPKGASYEMGLEDDAQIYALVSSGSGNVVLSEYAA